MTTARRCDGFTFSGLTCGIKKNGLKDLGLIYSEVPAAVAGVFTRNRVQAAPVLLDKQRIGRGLCQAVIVNSGNANCCTGEQGLADAASMARAAAQALGVAEDQVLVASTGVIGEPLPVAKIAAAAPRLAAELSSDGAMRFAEAIMTTDTVPKCIIRRAAIDGREVTLVGVAKGTGMIRPDMATMLAFVCTDAVATADTLTPMLQGACNRSFNCITVDGDTSTNDTVLLLANGCCGVRIDHADARDRFRQVLDQVLQALARALVKDGEGATKLVEIRVAGAANDHDARQVAETVAHSNLVKTALFGEDANWGRIMAAVGRAGVAMRPEQVDIHFGDIMLVQGGRGCGRTFEAAATTVMRQDEFSITIDLHLGRGNAQVLTCDFSYDYVKINADYRT